jgi:hypothetical protein
MCCCGNALLDVFLHVLRFNDATRNKGQRVGAVDAKKNIGLIFMELPNFIQEKYATPKVFRCRHWQDGDFASIASVTRAVARAHIDGPWGSAIV